MHTRRLSSFLLGAWLMGSLYVAFLATQNFANVKRILASPPAAIVDAQSRTGAENLRQLLRYQAAEANRFMFETWAALQLALGASLLAVLLFNASRKWAYVAAAGFMLAITMAATFLLIPWMNHAGRVLDFTAPGALLDERETFRNYHIAFSVLEIVKLAVGAGLTAGLLGDRKQWKNWLSREEPPAASRLRRRENVAD